MPNWQPHLIRWSREVVGRDFVLGETDCAMLALAALRVLYGRTPDCGCVPSYRTERERLLAHRETGGIATKVLDVAESITDRLHARSGDLVTFERDDRYGGVGVVVDGDFVTSAAERGVYRAPLAALEEASGVTFWRTA